MGRKISALIFLAVFATSVFVYFSQSGGDKQTPTEPTVREPIVVLEGLEFKQFENARPVKAFSARLGHLYEPNLIELYGEVLASRTAPEQTLKAESARSFFLAESLQAMLHAPPLERAEASGFVEMQTGQYVISTEQAEYQAAGEILKSQKAVRIESKGATFRGNDGFVFDLKTQTLYMPGSINGIVRSIHP